MLEIMKARDTKGNIKKIREKIKNIDISNGVSKNMSSSTQIRLQCLEMTKQLRGFNEMTKGHRLLNSYVYAYQDMLSLNNAKPETANAQSDSHGQGG